MHQFGRVYHRPASPGEHLEYQVNYVTDRPTTSLVVLTLAADNIQIYTQTSSGKIVSAFIDTFEALTTTGLLEVVIFNNGDKTASYTASRWIHYALL